MDSPRIDALVERVNRLERENSRLKWTGIASILALGAAAAAGAVRRSDVPQVVRAAGFVVVDEKGREVIRIKPGGRGQGSGLIEFLDTTGKRPLGMGLGEDDSPFVALADFDGQEQLVLNAVPKKGIGMTFRNLKRDAGLMLGINPDGVAALGFMSEGGKSALEMGLNPDGSSRLTMRDKSGKVLFETPKP